MDAGGSKIATLGFALAWRGICFAFSFGGLRGFAYIRPSIDREVGPEHESSRRPVRRCSPSQFVARALAMNLGCVHLGALKRAAQFAVIAAAASAAIGCGFSEERKQAEELAEQYFAKMQAGDVEGVLSLYSTRFFEVTSRADWLVFLEEQRARCGTPKTHSLINWNVLSTFGTNAGTRTTLVYDVQYSSCRVSEKMTIFKPSGGKIQIQVHFLTPKAGTQSNQVDLQATLKT